MPISKKWSHVELRDYIRDHRGGYVLMGGGPAAWSNGLDTLRLTISWNFIASAYPFSSKPGRQLVPAADVVADVLRQAATVTASGTGTHPR
ncbi:hypothetical protein [Frigoribacterium sp. VKM Ac-2836]|uniref:hypothetical protein n=1 Tax=Frigoribacterium sp. VKM Ac-2836 TaxID=2739014 RepID=UPI0015631999|nr:hypothetical protein [Frigoribacterium sp. VKM Ac-2836]NRD27280.1 hypothetical protein [Frigoribacterium sp. VKM Ac-2836]